MIGLEGGRVSGVLKRKIKDVETKLKERGGGGSLLTSAERGLEGWICLFSNSLSVLGEIPERFPSGRGSRSESG